MLYALRRFVRVQNNHAEADGGNAVLPHDAGAIEPYPERVTKSAPCLRRL